MTAKYLLLAAAFTAIGAAPPPAPPPAPAPQQAKSPMTTVVKTAIGSHIVGSPEAKHTLIEYMSYTCSHCATFEREGADAIKLGFVGQGKYRFEIRHYIFNVVDLAVATATHCAPTDRFFTVHSSMLKRQNEWLPKVHAATKAQQDRWEVGTPLQRFRAVAGDIDLYEMMENHGVSRVRLDKCFADETLYRPIVAQTNAASARGINSTPTFLLDGQRLAANRWPYVETAMNNRLKLTK